MAKQEKWLGHRIALTHTHFQEWKDSLAQERQARELIVDQYHQSTAHLNRINDPLEWSEHLIRYNADLASLTDEISSKRAVMTQRHESEFAVLEEQIRREQTELN